MATERSRMNEAKRHTARPMWNGDVLRNRLKHYDREPFLELLAAWMEAMPEPEVVAKWARAYPDRWIGAMSAISKMAGFADRKESTLNLNVSVADMSDSQLEDKLRELQQELGDGAMGTGAPLIELKPVDGEVEDLPKWQGTSEARRKARYEGYGGTPGEVEDQPPEDQPPEE